MSTATGMSDLYITNDGPNVLYRNRGDGTFADVTAVARVGEPRWSAGSSFADLDRDGDLDLWVVNYVTPTGRTARSGRRPRRRPILPSSAQVRPSAEYGVP